MAVLRAILGTLLAALLLAADASARPAATSISAADEHTCSTMSNGAVECWGLSYQPRMLSNVPVRVPRIRGAAAVQASFRYNCALLLRGRIACWGDDGYGQLGNGRTKDSPSPVKVIGITDAVAIAAGGFHACALRATGAIACWGRNVRGALGDGLLTNSSVPMRVSGITNAVAVSAGYIDDETCAVLATGTVRCWGANAHGQLGNGTTTDSTTPVNVTGISDAVGVAASGGHACAVLHTGRIECWGNNSFGQLGNGTQTSSLIPVPVKGISDGRAVAVDPRGYSCAVLRSGAVYCWGHNPRDQLGNGRQPEGSLVPVRALNIDNAVSITTATGHACALLSSGGADCWGHDDYGKLGKGGGLPVNSDPVPVLFGRLPIVRAHAPCPRVSAVACGHPRVTAPHPRSHRRGPRAPRHGAGSHTGSTPVR